MLEVYIPTVGHQVLKSDKTRTVFKVDVLCNGRRHSLDRRYSEFHALHKLLKKTCKVPDFPPKRVPNWMSKVQEQRRQGLEAYIQGVLWFNKEVPQELLDFLKLKHFPQSKKNCNFQSEHDVTSIENSFRLAHKAVVGFHKDLYILPPETVILEDTVLQGVLWGVYQHNHKKPPSASQAPSSKFTQTMTEQLNVPSAGSNGVLLQESAVQQKTQLISKAVQDHAS